LWSILSLWYTSPPFFYLFPFGCSWGCLFLSLSSASRVSSDPFHLRLLLACSLSPSSSERQPIWFSILQIYGRFPTGFLRHQLPPIFHPCLIFTRHPFFHFPPRKTSGPFFATSPSYEAPGRHLVSFSFNLWRYCLVIARHSAVPIWLPFWPFLPSFLIWILTSITRGPRQSQPPPPVFFLADVESPFPPTSDGSDLASGSDASSFFFRFFFSRRFFFFCVVPLGNI